MKYKYFYLLLPALFFCSLGLIAQETEGPGDIITDRPDETESPFLLPKGFLQIETGFFYEEREEDLSKSKLTTYNTTLLRYGLLENLELRLGTDLVKLREETPGLAERELETGFEPLLVGAKVGIADENGLLPQIGLLGHLHLPFGASKDYQPETTGVDFRFAFSHTLSPKSNLSYNLGAAWTGDSAEASYLYTIAYGYSITDALGIYGELYGDLPESDKAEHQWDAGLTYLLAGNVQLDAFVGSGIGSPQQLWIGGGISVRIPE